jgi:hypothetical protein
MYSIQLQLNSKFRIPAYIYGSSENELGKRIQYSKIFYDLFNFQEIPGAIS